jgi:peptidoglycan hydrolase-like protein with peptidoglycan-binding domain
MTSLVPGRSSRVVALVVVLLLAAASGFWAGRVTLRPAATASELPAGDVVVTVSEQSVGRSLNLNVTVTQPRTALAANALSGVVTSVGNAGAVNVGDVLYSVAAIPVRAVQGTMPFYRPLQEGASGADVRQLEGALVALGLLGTADAAFDGRTRAAVQAWQGKLGLERTGTVALGELVAVPTLPAGLLLDETVLRLGVPLNGGEQVVFGSAGDPEFALVLSEQQARLIPMGSSASMTYRGQQWTGVVTGVEDSEIGQVRLPLTAPAGGPVCGADCGLVAPGSDVSILAQVSVVAPATGPAVPVAALRTQPDGSARVLVVNDAGVRSERTVTVLGSQDGVAVVEGVALGERVQVLAGGATEAGTAGAAPRPAPAASPSK